MCTPLSKSLAIRACDRREIMIGSSDNSGGVVVGALVTVWNRM